MSQDDAKERLIAAAGPLFAEQGYDAATVRQICDTAGVNLASVNYYFGDKHQLYVATVASALRAGANEVGPPDEVEGLPPEEALRRLVFQIALHMLQNEAEPWQLRLIMREVIRPSDVGRAMIERAFRPFYDRLLKVVGRLLPDDTPLFRRQFVVFSIIGQCVYYRNARDVITQLTSPEQVKRHFKPEALARHIYEFSLAGIAGAGEIERDGATESWSVPSGEPS